MTHATLLLSGEVTDESYRKAYKLDTDKFAAMLDVAQTGILHTVQKVLALGCEYVIAEPYKLNVYAEGGFFKVHKDTPRGNDMFGSLVLTLPQGHMGGDLVVRHEDRVCRHSPLRGIEQEESIQWVAFYSDCDHEVEKVTSGTRITLTFNLYRVDSDLNLECSEEAEAPIDSDLYTAMGRLVSVRGFKGILGLPLEHVYDPHDQEWILKGRDLVVYNTLIKRDNVTVERWLAVKLENRRQAAKPEQAAGAAAPSSSGAAAPPQANEFMFIKWDGFQMVDEGPEMLLENHDFSADFFTMCYNARDLPVTWVQEPTKFLYEDRVAAYDRVETGNIWEREKITSETVHAAGCLLVLVDCQLNSGTESDSD